MHYLVISHTYKSMLYHVDVLRTPYVRHHMSEKHMQQLTSGANTLYVDGNGQQVSTPTKQSPPKSPLPPPASTYFSNRGSGLASDGPLDFFEISGTCTAISSFAGGRPQSDHSEAGACIHLAPPASAMC